METIHHQQDLGRTKKMFRQCMQTFREIAVRYYPRVIPEVASRKLRRLIKEDPYMLRDLERLGFRKEQRHITAQQYESLVFHLGTPEEFITYC